MNTNNIDYNEKILKGFFLLLLAIMGNFTAETLGCKIRYILTNNILVKNLLTFFLLYFAVDFTSLEGLNPIKTFQISSIIYLLFILFNKNIPIFTLIIFLLLAVGYICLSFIKHYKKTDEVLYTDNIKYIENYLKINKFIIIFLLILGFIFYFKKQYKDHKKNWSTITFLFGKINCDSMK